MADDDLIAQCLSGSREAFSELVKRYQNRLYTCVYRILGNPEDSMDVVQEAFLSAFVSLRRFKGRCRFSTWLHRIATNCAINLKRERKARYSLEDYSTANEPFDPNDANQPSYELEQAEVVARVRRALATLEPEERALLIMKDADGLRYSKIASILDVPVGTVRSRLHRARMKLSGLLQQTDAVGAWRQDRPHHVRR